MNSSENFEKNIELWGGVECTVNRVRNHYFDQLKKSGHDQRLSDLELFAQLGIRRIRYPVLWERVAPNKLKNADWSWTDVRLNRLRELNVRPIAGLLHHGSGPSETSLVDLNFPEKFAEFALRAAERYPWIDAYTPINEPLTTARFSGLYGFWYPHRKNDRAFARALINQCRGSIFAMQAIRKINPNAQFVQTEDLGKTYSTPKLKYQAKFENLRRWLTFDLLCGRLNREHRFWRFLNRAGIEEAELEWFLENACPPDVVGVNYYLTSERYLDEKIENYRGFPVGGNHRAKYVDIEAVRANIESPTGFGVLMREVWERYKLPLAITEVHLGCTREEQLRWFLEIWNAANILKQEGVDLRAVTVWSLLGSFDWNSLLTASHNHYESGVFDVRSPTPRPTALANLMKNIASGQKFENPAADGDGWWKRPSRFVVQPNADKAQKTIHFDQSPAKKIFIVGATGTLGQAFARMCTARNLSYQLLSRQEMDIADFESIKRATADYQPWAIINAAGYVRVDTAEAEAANCFSANTKGAVNLAAVCEQNKISYLTFSSDLVFDGIKKNPYIESDFPNPLNVYGNSKAAAEKQILEINPNALIVRTAAFFSPWDKFNFLSVALNSLASGQAFKAANDNFVSPTYLPDLINACLDILIDGESGLWHLANQGELTWADFARQAAELANLNASLVIECSSADLNLAAQRPVYSVLGSERGTLLPTLDNSLNKFVHAFQPSL
jgi:dTDP-4-dehydrorhamnose reductase